MSLLNRDLDDCGATSSNSSALCGATCHTGDSPRAAAPSSLDRRDLRAHPSCGSHGDASRRFGPGRRLVAVQRPRSVCLPSAQPLRIVHLRIDVRGAYSRAPNHDS